MLLWVSAKPVGASGVEFPVAGDDEDGGGFILEVDIEKYFDTMDYGHLRNFLDKRVRDGVLKKVINRWLKVEVMEEERIYYPGGVGHPKGV
jgi:hypothetical protein